MRKLFQPFSLATIALICVYLVVLAGSIVRVTGSGMGCPDWPQCFGYVIPPTSQEVLTIAAGKSFKEGQMVIYHDTLWVAQYPVVINDQLTFMNSGSEAAWKKYPKHDYAIFNAAHTWIEYINRLLTGLLGLPVLLLFLVSVREGMQKKGWGLFLWSGLTLAFMLYEAWLGKLVVDGELSTGKVTLHMLGSLGIVITLMVAREQARSERIKEIQLDRKWWLLGMSLLAVQMILGTQLREVVDEVIKSGWDRNQWMEQVQLSGDRLIFYIHRTFSWILVAYIFWMTNALLKLNLKREAIAMMTVVGLETFLGVLLNYFEFPAFAQPLHLLLAFILFGILLNGFLSKRASIS
jgi:heme a synthase